MILCIGTTPAAQRVMVFSRLALDVVNRATTTVDGAAGKSINVAKVLQTLGARPVAVGFLGGPRGDELRAILEAKGIENEFVAVEAATRQCITVIDGSSNTQTELVQESSLVTQANYQELLDVVQRRVPECKAAVMSGTLAPGVPEDFYLRCTELARTANSLSVLDAQGRALLSTLEARPGLVKPNQTELAATLGRELAGDSATLDAMRELHNRGAERVVVTAGKKPTLAFDGRTFWKIASPKITPVNPIGSGDSFTAGLVLQLLKGVDLGEACRWATAAGAANAITLMAAEVNPSDVKRLAGGVEVERLRN
jgi:tagatose 6-phosphate kinase